jgi:hypothetical protein
VNEPNRSEKRASGLISTRQMQSRPSARARTRPLPATGHLRVLISSRSSVAKVPASSRFYSSQNPSRSHTSSFTRLRRRLKSTNTWADNGSGRRTSCTCALSRSNDPRKSVAPRATKTRTPAAASACRPQGPEHPLQHGAIGSRRHPVPDARCARRSREPLAALEHRAALALRWIPPGSPLARRSPRSRRRAGRPATTPACSSEFRAPQTRAPSIRYAASAPTPDASAVH